jgi:predicted membrane protein
MWQIACIAVLAIAFFIAKASKNLALWVTAFLLLGAYVFYWAHKLLQIFMSIANPS